MIEQYGAQYTPQYTLSWLNLYFEHCYLCRGFRQQFSGIFFCDLIKYVCLQDFFQGFFPVTYFLAPHSPTPIKIRLKNFWEIFYLLAEGRKAPPKHCIWNQGTSIFNLSGFIFKYTYFPCFLAKFTFVQFPSKWILTLSKSFLKFCLKLTWVYAVLQLSNISEYMNFRMNLSQE